VNNNLYVGESGDFSPRQYLHNIGQGDAPALKAAILKWGLVTLKIYIIKLMPGSTRKQREVVERQYFRKLACTYNIWTSNYPHPNALLLKVISALISNLFLF